ncbi:hypothetical protein MM239_16880 [Belliella sp. DSM 111904]|uniref:Uncharacterized protein n=1 Tax=Belliella filtrata TaxID=2923435 RepID=A0ABS9V525_9BACT|nr:hypothetical protein [Belliella filtrata]MCH7411083.1 hypothetical protein [Belliella filtrata]
MEKYDRENQTEWVEFVESLARYAAIFDSDYKLLQDDIDLPPGTISTPVVNKEELILIHKNQKILGEEDWNTYYLLQLKDRNLMN